MTGPEEEAAGRTERGRTEGEQQTLITPLWLSGPSSIFNLGVESERRRRGGRRVEDGADREKTRAD